MPAYMWQSIWDPCSTITFEDFCGCTVLVILGALEILNFHWLPWYNYSGWLGIKHQVTYLPLHWFLLSMPSLKQKETPSAICQHRQLLAGKAKRHIHTAWSLLELGCLRNVKHSAATVYLVILKKKKEDYSATLSVNDTRCEQVLFVYVLMAIPPQLSDSCNFITVLLVTWEPEQTTLLFWSTVYSITPHGLHTADHDSCQCMPFSNLFSPSIFWPLVCLPTLCSLSPFYALSHVEHNLAS